MVAEIRGTARLTLRAPVESDAELLRDYYARNAARFERWDAARSRDVADHLRWIRERAAEAGANGFTSSFLAFEKNAPPDSAALVGVVSLTGFERTEASAMIDYTLDAAYEGRGFAREAVGAVANFAFGRLGMTSLTAFYDAQNARSAKLLAHLGFVTILQMPQLPGPTGALRSQIVAKRTR